MKILALLALMLVFATQQLYSQSKKIKEGDLPEAVIYAFNMKYPKAHIQSCSKEKRSGADCFEIESIDEGTKLDLIYFLDGTVAEMEEEVLPAKLPENIKQGVAKKYPKGKILTAEKLTTQKVEEFEIIVQIGKKKVGLILDMDGTIRKTIK